MTSKTVTTQQLAEALKPFAALGGPHDGFPAYQDLEDDVVVYKNSGECITAGDVRRARDLMHMVARWQRRAVDTSSDVQRSIDRNTAYERDIAELEKVLQAAVDQFPNDDGWLDRAKALLAGDRLPEEPKAGILLYKCGKCGTPMRCGPTQWEYQCECNTEKATGEQS